MRARRIEIVGGGPAGLYAARLLRLARPAWEVVVHERTAPDAGTFGFGVGLTASTMERLEENDPVSAADVRAASVAGHSLVLARGDERVALHGARNVAIGRSVLLEVLARHAEAAGARLERGVQVDAADLDADVVIASDGVRSPTRAALAPLLGVSEEDGRGVFVWCGTDVHIGDALFESVRTEHGLFVVHAYPYGTDRSTVLVETDEATLAAAGLGSGPLDASGSDQASLAHLQDVFAPLLAGHRLLGNRSRFSHFTTVHLDRWSHGRTVLIGDAAHTAHYTMGSGTKLALEDAIALVSSLTAAEDLATQEQVEAALEDYGSRRRPAVARFQRLAERSQRWWESYAERESQPLAVIAAGYMSRTGNLGLAALADGGSTVLFDALSVMTGPGQPGPAPFEQTSEPASSPTASAPRVEGVGPIDAWVLAQPVEVAGHLLPSRVVQGPDDLRGEVLELSWSLVDPWCPEADAAVQRVCAASTDALWLTGEDGADAVLGRLDLAERVRLATGTPVVVTVPPEHLADGAAALVAGRCDAVSLAPASARRGETIAARAK